jgi:hypothetical protein
MTDLTSRFYRLRILGREVASWEIQFEQSEVIEQAIAEIRGEVTQMIVEMRDDDDEVGDVMIDDHQSEHIIFPPVSM